MIRPELWEALLKLALLGAVKRPVTLNSSAFARSLGLSQQTASRRLIELERLGLIRRDVHFRGQTVILTERGVEELREVYVELKRIFEEEVGRLTVEGVVFTGLGEGAYYVSREGYRRQFVEKLGFDPYPGTLNIKRTHYGRDTMEFIAPVNVRRALGLKDGDRVRAEIYLVS